MFLFKKNGLKAALLLFIFFGTTNAMELRTLVQFDFPSDVSIDKNVKDVKKEKNKGTSPVVIVGADFSYAAEFSNFHYGASVGIKSAQKKKDVEITPMALPVGLNLSYGLYKKDYYFSSQIFSPYGIVRAGTLLPITADGHWWRRPYNFFAGAGIGVIVPYNIGIEVNYNYSSMRKSFTDKHTDFRVSSGRLGIQVSMGFALSHDRIYKPNVKVIEDTP